jgi:hypothetical protein
MKLPDREELAQSAALEGGYGKLERLGIGPGWRQPASPLRSSPRKRFHPAHRRDQQARHHAKRRPRSWPDFSPPSRSGGSGDLLSEMGGKGPCMTISHHTEIA